MRFAQRLNPHPRVESVSLRTERTRGVAWRDARSFCFGAVWPLKTPEQISYKVRRRFEHEIVLNPCVACVIKPRDPIDPNPDAPLYLHVFNIFSTTFKHSKSSSTTSTLKPSGKFFDSTIVPLTGAPMAANDGRVYAEAQAPSRWMLTAKESFD